MHAATLLLLLPLASSYLLPQSPRRLPLAAVPPSSNQPPLIPTIPHFMHEFWSGLLTIQSSSALTSTLVLSAPPTPPDATSTSTSISAATLPAVLPRILGHLNDCADCASVYQTDVLASIDSSGPGLVEVTFTRGGGGAEEEDDDWGDGFELSGALAGLAFEDDDEDGEASASANHDATIAAACVPLRHPTGPLMHHLLTRSSAQVHHPAPPRLHLREPLVGVCDDEHARHLPVHQRRSPRRAADGQGALRGVLLQAA